MAKQVAYDDVAKMMSSGSGRMLDVRSQEELDTHGKYPSYIHVPHTELEAAMQLPEAEFKQRYHADKPKPSDLVMTSCMAGKRASAAAEALVKLNFVNVCVYGGSFSDWKKHQSDPATEYKG